MASMQIRALLELLDAAPIRPIAGPFGAWCDTWIRPWVEDHLAFDAEAIQRWQGHDLDLGRRLTSAAIVAAAQADPGSSPCCRVPRDDRAPPSSLAPAEGLAARLTETGWRPPESRRVRR